LRRIETKMSPNIGHDRRESLIAKIKTNGTKMKPKYNQNGAKMKQRWHQTRTGNPHMQTRVWKYSNRAKRKPDVAQITPQYTQRAK
jgi:hypothetical protein